MHKKRNLAIAIIVSAAAGMFALQNVFAPSPAELPVSTFTLTSTATITSSPTYEGCGYMWAYHDDPTLTAKLDEAVRDLDPSASANAQLFGEDCVYADGHSTFSTMETDFYVRFSVEDFSSEEAFGNWIKQIMDFIIGLPEDEVQGRKGFVEFSFTKNEDEHLIVRVGISDYLNSAVDADALEVFKKFYTPTPPPVTPGPITPTPTP
jgi:hypothetical protein